MGKIIVITGAGDGLGRALARRFARDGETVVLLGRTLAKVQAVRDEIGAEHLAIECDVARPDSVRAAFRQVAERHPKIDVLINNAAVYEPFSLAEVTDQQIAAQLEINVSGPIYCAREALPLLGRGGHIVNVTSESSHVKMPMPWMYAGTKAALEFISDMWVDELRPAGVRVTIVRAGQMMDETKTGSSWDPEVSRRFAEANARVGLNLRERPISHYNSVTDVFRAVLDTPPDVHVPLVAISGHRPAS